MFVDVLASGKIKKEMEGKREERREKRVERQRKRDRNRDADIQGKRQKRQRDTNADRQRERKSACRKNEDKSVILNVLVPHDAQHLSTNKFIIEDELQS